VAGGWKRLHNKLCNLYASPNNITVMKSSIVRWAGHVACMENIRYTYRIFVGKPE
jgi:hypothetical protein